jgi:hypothetical protein
MLGLYASKVVSGMPHQGRHRRTRVVAVGVVAALSLGLAACSSSPAAPTYNPTTAKADINTSYDSLFHFTSGSLASKEAVIQNGKSVAAAMKQALASSEASAADGAKVDSVSFLSATGCSAKSLPSPCAKVKYDILGTSGTAILAGNTGYTVLTNGTWQVAKTTICTLLGLFYTAEGKTGSPPGC